MINLKELESITEELMQIYSVQAPPVPIESMLQHPVDNMWEELDISKLSSSFINVRDYYSPRMSLARLLARHIVSSPWGKDHNLTDVARDEDSLRAFARMLMMPGSMIMGLSVVARTPERMSVHFEVPLEDAEMRLQEMS